MPRAVLCAAALVLALWVPPVAADCDETLDVQTTQDACSQGLAVSATGNASSGSPSPSAREWEGTCADPCAAISGTGDATTYGGGVAASGTGEARSEAGRYCSGIQAYPLHAGCIAASGTGPASTHWAPGCWVMAQASCLSVSGTGSASNAGAGNGCGYDDGLHCVAVSGTGDAANDDFYACGENYAAAGASLSVSCIAASGTGEASNDAEYCGWDNFPEGDVNPLFPALASEHGSSVACAAVSGAGDAGNEGCGSGRQGTERDQWPDVQLYCLTVDSSGPASAP